MMVAEHFRDLIDIDGVEAVILYDNLNNVIDSWTTEKYNPAIFQELGETFLHVFGLIEYLKYDMNELAVPFDRGIVFGRAHAKFYMVIIARLAVEISLIRLAVNVCLGDFVENRKVKKMLKKLSDKKFYQIKSITLDDVEKIMLENILEFNNGAQ